MFENSPTTQEFWAMFFFLKWPQSADNLKNVAGLNASRIRFFLQLRQVFVKQWTVIGLFYWSMIIQATYFFKYCHTGRSDWVCEQYESWWWPQVLLFYIKPLIQLPYATFLKSLSRLSPIQPVTTISIMISESSHMHILRVKSRYLIIITI